MKKLVLALLLAGCSGSPTPAPTASATRSSMLEQARQQFQAGQFDQSAATASLAMEIAKEARDAPAELECRVLKTCSEAHLKGAFPLKDLKALKNEKNLSAGDRQHVESELKTFQDKAIENWKAGEKSFADKKYQQALDETQQALNQLASLEDHSKDGEGKFRLSECYRHLGDKGKAQEMLEDAAHSSPPSAEAVKQLAAARPKRPSGLQRGADGSIVIVNYGGLVMSLDARNQVRLTVQGDSGSCGISMTREEWANFKAAIQEMQTQMDNMSGGGSSKVVQNGYTVDMAIVIGTVRSWAGWEVRSPEPAMEVWLLDKLAGSSTPWRASIGGSGMMIQQVDEFLKTAPAPLEYNPKTPVPARLAGHWTGSTDKPYEPGFEVWFSGTPAQVKGIMVWQGRDNYATLTGPLQDRRFSFVMNDFQNKPMGRGYLEVDSERGATFKGKLEWADGKTYGMSGSK